MKQMTEMISTTAAKIIRIFMDNTANFKINLEFLGLGNANKAETALKSVAECCIDLKALTEPLAKIGKVLESIDRVMLKLSGDTKKSTEHLERMSADSKAGLERLVSIEERVQKGLKGIGDEADKVKKKLSLVDSLKSLSDGILSLGTIKDQVMGVLSPVMESGMARETAAVNFDTLLSKEVKEQGVSGKDFADYLRGTDAAALYGTDVINQNAQAMLAYGVDAATTVEVLKSIGDIAMGDAQKMNSLATAFSQMNSLGKLQSQDWKQMVGAGFNPFIQMQKDLGKTAEELDAMMGKGEITADMVKDAFVNATKEGGQFAGALGNVMENTMQGSIANLSGMWDDLLANVFELIKPLLDKVIPVIGKVIAQLGKFSPVIEGIVAVAGPVLDWIGESVDELMALATAIGVVALAVWAVNSPILLVTAAVGALIYVAVELMKVFDDWGAAVSLLIGPLGSIVIIVQTIRRYWDDIVNAFESDGIIGSLKRIGVCIMDMLLYPVQQLLGWVGELTGWEWTKKAQGFVEEYRKSIGAIDTVKGDADGSEPDGDEGFMAKLLAAAGVGGDAGGGGGGNALAAATGKGNEAVASGGTRSTNVTITVEKVVEQMNFNGGVEENTDELSRRLEFIVGNILYGASRYMRG